MGCNSKGGQSSSKEQMSCNHNCKSCFQLRTLFHQEGFLNYICYFLQHFLLGVKFVLALVIPDVPQWVQDEMASQQYKDKLSLRVSSNEMERSPFDARLFPSNNFFFHSVEFAKAVQFRNFRPKHFFTISTFWNASLKAAFTFFSGPLFWSWSVLKRYHGNQTTRTDRAEKRLRMRAVDSF